MTDAEISISASDLIAQRSRLVKAAYRSGPILPFGDDDPTFDVHGALAVRQTTVDAWRSDGRRIVGRKIGLTSPALRERLGAPQQTQGFLFADTQVADGGVIDFNHLIQPLAEAELGLILAHDIDVVGNDPRALRSAIGGATVAIEIVDCRFEDWRIGYADAIADNGSAAGFVLSAERVPLVDADGKAWEMERIGGAAHISGGQVDLDAILRDLHWLAKAALAAREPLRRDEIILSGSLGGAIPMARGDAISARIAGLGACSVSFQ
ncbi:fumarylacetoacetate hydrolase family protein [uncultured Sphingobium sp.]|uniref:2-keto-4-pentenoate hydratase n=1 Tax=uncultured Sphingobium sp. TaxID=316087 RepID=UPI00259B1ED4|nr:fumarylacetoacetate hydrolase family protein [uncultured Sphingobium sp.]